VYYHDVSSFEESTCLSRFQNAPNLVSNPYSHFLCQQPFYGHTFLPTTFFKSSCSPYQQVSEVGPKTVQRAVLFFLLATLAAATACTYAWLVIYGGLKILAGLIASL